MKPDTNIASSAECSQQDSPMQRQPDLTVPAYAVSGALRIIEIEVHRATDQLRKAEQDRDFHVRSAAAHQTIADSMKAELNRLTHLVRTLASLTQPA